MSLIIPGLIDDLGREVLIRLPYQHLPTASLVCKLWRIEITSPRFSLLRKAMGVARPLMVVAQARTDTTVCDSGDGRKQNPTQPAHRIQLNLHDPRTQTWTRLPVNPRMLYGLPLYCRLVGSGSELLVMGGLDPLTWRATSAVYIYCFLTGKWRKGADMPGIRRSFFGCTSSDHRTVLVAGGHDEDKNALGSAMLYYVDKDEWAILPDMAIARDECKAIFHRGKFHIISGYPTDKQGCFERTAEVFDTSTWQWGPVVEDFLEASASPSSCVAASNGMVYACLGRRSSDVAVQFGDNWQVIGKVPADVRSSRWVSAYEPEKLIVIGSSKIGEAKGGYTLDLKSSEWNKIDVPKEFCGHVQSGGVLDI